MVALSINLGGGKSYPKQVIIKQILEGEGSDYSSTLTRNLNKEVFH
jgi:hypothetical protein